MHYFGGADRSIRLWQKKITNIQLN